MYRKLHLYIFIICSCYIQQVYAQTHKIDNLKKQLALAAGDEQKAAALLNLCRQNYSLTADSLYQYANALKKISNKNLNKQYQVLADYYITYSLLFKGMEDSSLQITNRYLEKLSNNKEKHEAYMLFLQLKGLYYFRTNKRKETVDVFYELLNEAKQRNDTLNMLVAKRGISLSYIISGQDQEALKLIYNAITLIPDRSLEKYREIYGLILVNAGICFLHLHQATHSKIFADSCDYYTANAIAIGRKSENLFLLCQGLIVNGLILSYKKQFAEAEKKLQEGLQVRKMIGDTIYIISDMSVLASFYANTKQLEKGVAIANKGIELVRGRKISSALLLLLYNALAENYKATGNYKQYADALKLLMAIKDSLNKKNSADELNNLQVEYDAQKKENTIVKQKLDIIQSNNLLYGAIGFLIFSILLASVFFTGYSKRRKLKEELLLKEEKRQAKIAVKDAGEKERRRISADLHDNMGAYATAIIANVDDMIVNKKTHNESAFTNLKTNAGELMSNLRDTIWASNKENFFLTGISDRFKIYIQKISPAYPAVNVEITEAITNNISFSPVQALNIFRILQEAFTNALKHSGANLINIFFESDNRLYIAIKDNGGGINDTDYLNNGNGIKNMKSRALESGLHLSIEKNEATGTVISITSQSVLQI